MKNILIIICLILILIKINSNNLIFLPNQNNKENKIYENFNNPPKNFLCEKDELACIISYQKYNNDCKKAFPVWKKFQDLYHNKKIKNRKLFIFAIDSLQNPGNAISGSFDGPRVSLVSRFNIINYDGRLNINNLQKFLDNNI
tara:strand:- start:698 stop:1126 length:429 start_codon:yes stop_codon:yes gene_type:complete